MKKVIVFLSFIVVLISCSTKDKPFQNIIIRGEVFGTIYSISYFSPDGKNYKLEIDSLFNEFNNSLSYYQPQSLISRINRNETDIPDKYFLKVLNKAKQISEETNGAFDVTVTPLVNLWGFGFEKKSDVTRKKIDSVLDFVGYNKARIESGRIVKDDPRVMFDFNAIAKGYAADVIGEFLEMNGVSSFMVEIGGDLIAKGLKPGDKKWRIGIERPAKEFDDPQDWQYLIELHNQAIATSGNYRRYYEKDGIKYSHTITPQTGYPTENTLLSASVIAGDAMTADAYATAFMVMGLEKAIEFVEAKQDIEAFFIYSKTKDELGTFKSSGILVVEREK
ncbi:MAG: FAD:protein FMN transferase [Bacteroidetes bacterium]|nr:FAD:protein FMN transferase [Bacteroidota bacterium]